MDIIKEADFRREIKKTPADAYLFFGEEDYLKTADIDAARGAICPDEAFAPFNFVSFDALDFSPDKLDDALLAPPMMSDRKLVVVRGLDFTSMKQSDADTLISVCSHAGEGGCNTLILSVAAGALDVGYLPKKPSALFQKLAAVLRPVQFDRCTTAQLCAWAIRHYAAAGTEATQTIASATVTRCGHDMFRLSSEIEKIAIYALAHGRKTVTADDVMTVGIAAEEFDSFAFANAILDRRRDEALRVLADMKLRRVDPSSALGEVIRVWCDLAAVKGMMNEGRTPAEIGTTLKMHTYKVGLYTRAAAGITDEAMKHAIGACIDADTSMKSVSGQGFRPLELLICSL